MKTGLVAGLADGTLPPGFTRSRVVVPAGGSLRCDQATWQGALVLLAGGSIRLTPPGEVGVRFETGAVLAIADLTRYDVVNPGEGPAVLVAIARSPVPPGRRAQGLAGTAGARTSGWGDVGSGRRDERPARPDAAG